MDRRKKKTREAILKAFISLLSEKKFNHITVEEIINKADVGRATFYAHFPTKDFLLKELCVELFEHIFESHGESGNSHTGIFNCDAPDSIFLHLFTHIKKNDNNILQLLISDNTDLFLEYFKSNFSKLIASDIVQFNHEKPQELPDDFWVNHISSCFMETVKWWIKSNVKLPPEKITEYFMLSV